LGFRRGRAKGKKPRKDSTGSPEPAGGRGIPDPRANEQVMSKISRLLREREFGSMEEATAFLNAHVTGRPIDEVLGGGPQSDLQRAQDLMYQAFDAPDRRWRIRMAEQALEISPDCADAYSLLAEEKANSAAEARPYYEKAVEAGERALGAETFEEEAGHFWGILETRPYMRAREGLAECLWMLGEREEAIGHWDDMLRLNPNDNQGVRDALITRLLLVGEHGKAGEVLERYAEDGSANRLYNRALWLYVDQGESPEAESALLEAVEHNEHVPAYLLGEKKPPRDPPAYMGVGDASEAQVYAAEGVELWRRIEGARGWLLRVTQRHG
jgi:tetratricopeptide (TPR) repeat protein